MADVDYGKKIENGEVLRSVEYAKAYGATTFSSISDVQFQPRYDLIYQEITLFIEGVQVPFEFLSVSNAYGATPEATIAVPYYPGILEICKGYFPKVHIFFKDLNFQKFLDIKGVNYEEKDLRRLLFTGVIVGSSYSKNKSTDSDAVQVSFRCVHKYYAMQEVIIKMIGGGSEQISDPSRNGSVATGNMFNSYAATTLAMAGVKIPAEDSDYPIYRPDPSNPINFDKVNAAHLQEDLKPYQDRLTGMTGILVNIWNSLKRDSYRNLDYAKMMTDLYIPMVDGNLKFFKRLSGHPVIEGPIQKDKSQIPPSIKKKIEGTKHVDDSVTIIAPPVHANFLQKAATIEAGLTSMVSFFSSQPEATDYIGMVAGVLKYLKYDMEVLACPVQILDTSKESIDVIVKPTLPQYYSPTCNVLLPHMHSSIRYDDFTYAVPTRMTASMTPYEGVNNEQAKKSYLTPEEARIVTSTRCMSKQFNLDASTVYVGGYPTPLEYGRGVKMNIRNLDPWIQHINASELAKATSSSDTGGAMGNANKYYKVPTDKMLEEDRAVINPYTSELEDLNDTTRVWKYWDKAIPIPKYIASTDAPGWNMEWGVEGKLSAQDTTVVTKIAPFRTATSVPKYWNVLYFPDNNAFIVFPPHYDYMRNEFYQIEALRLAKASYGRDPYVGNNQTVAITESAATAKLDSSDPFKAINTLPSVLDTALAGPTVEKTEQTASTSSSSETPQYSTYGGYKTYEQIQEILKDEWNRSHPGMPTMNPYADFTVNQTQPYETTIYGFLDYEFSLAMTDSRSGSAECPFNPFIIPGYPMDIVEASPEKPSIHAFCTSVTHSVTASSITTSITFIGAATYDELRAYRSFPVPPWFAYHLGLTQANSIMNQSDSAMEIASKFYMEVLGVGVADPAKLEDYVSGGASTVIIKDGNMVKEGGNLFDRDSFDEISTPYIGAAFKEALNPNASYEGNLSLVRREIESQVDIERLTGAKFIDIQSRRIFDNSEEALQVSPTYKTVAVDVGRSVFLDYSLEDKLLSDDILARGATPTTASKGGTGSGR